MKRRLDLALALVHRPRILFLDEPTTGLDIQSRTALWEEVGRLADEEGVTVFLTTQYLEEADALADRVGIIDHGRIVAEGTPAALKAEIGRPRSRRSRREPGDTRRSRRCWSASESRAGASPRAAAVRLDGGEATSPRWSARSTPRASRIDDLQLHAPSLDDVFLAKTGRSLEGAGDETSEAEEAASRGRRQRERAACAPRSGSWPAARSCARCASRRRSCPRSLFPLLPARRQLRRAAGDRPAPGLPDRLLPDLRPRGPLHAGRALRGDERRHRPRRATSRPASSTAWR